MWVLTSFHSLPLPYHFSCPPVQPAPLVLAVHPLYYHLLPPLTGSSKPKTCHPSSVLWCKIFLSHHSVLSSLSADSSNILSRCQTWNWAYTFSRPYSSVKKNKKDAYCWYTWVYCIVIAVCSRGNVGVSSESTVIPLHLVLNKTWICCKHCIWITALA